MMHGFVTVRFRTFEILHSRFMCRHGRLYWNTDIDCVLRIKTSCSQMSDVSSPYIRLGIRTTNFLLFCQSGSPVIIPSQADILSTSGKQQAHSLHVARNAPVAHECNDA